MSKTSDTPKRIPEVKIPKFLKKELVVLHDIILESWKAQPDWDFTSGVYPRPKLDLYSDVCIDTISLISDINNVIQNLNIVLTDLHSIGTGPNIHTFLKRDELTKRYYLLVRTFFYELFRAKEIYSRFLKNLKRKDVLPKQEVQEYKEEFIKLFNTYLEIRNRMVHRDFVFSGLEHQTLMLTEAARDRGMAFASIETGKIITTEEVLGKLCPEFNEMALAVGNGLVHYFQVISNAACIYVQLKKEGQIDPSDYKIEDNPNTETDPNMRVRNDAPKGGT